MDAFQVRRAGPADAQPLVELRALMLTDMGVEVGPADAPWRAAAEDWFRRRLPHQDEIAAFVATDRTRNVVSCAVGTCDLHVPGPASLSGLHGHVSNMSTAIPFRRRGLARQCLAALLDWFDQETAVRVIDLNATGSGRHLYRELGFAPPRFEALQRRPTQQKEPR